MISNNMHEHDGCITIGRMAPDFTALSTEGPITLSQFRGKWVLLFYEPGDFTPTATTELMEFARLYPEFEKRDVQLLGVTIDSNSADVAWVFDIYKNTGIRIPFPLISDRNAEIAQLYDTVSPDRIYEVSVRDVFIISPSQNIRAIVTYPISAGLNIYELLRLIDSLQATYQYNVYTPSNWMPGNPVLVPAPSTLEEAVQRWNNQSDLGLQCNSWYTCFKELNNNNVDNSNSTSQ